MGDPWGALGEGEPGGVLDAREKTVLTVVDVLVGLGSVVGTVNTFLRVS